MTYQMYEPARAIAVVGMAARLPGSPDTASFWRLLTDRGDAIVPVPRERWDASAQLDPEFAIQPVGGFLDDVTGFDATFFGISPREAVVMDPQHRLMLETTWRALEDGGIRAADLAGTRVGVYVGASWHDYELLRKERGAPHTQHSAFGNALDVIASRVSYFLRATGPSLTVETGCSSSLMALHLASCALRDGDIDGAVVGGVNLILTPDMSIGLTHFGGLSASGRCRAFAATADGFVRGEGVIALYLKRLDRALTDGDQVQGVIVRTEVNNDGGGESLVTPSQDGQADLLDRVYGSGDVPLDRLAYIEAHGTGTGRGDPIEAAAIGRVMARLRDRALGPLPIGSVKTNIGHLEPAAGLAGLVKVLLALRHRIVPPSLHAGQLNPEIPFGELNLRVLDEPLELSAGEQVYLGVNSFGWGGTNAHVVITDPPGAAARQDPLPGPVLLTLSARTEQVLGYRAGELAAALRRDRLPLTAVAGTLAHRRDHFQHRLALPAATTATAADLLDHFAADPNADLEGLCAGRALPVGKVAFVFPGQGSQWAGMGREMYGQDPVFTAAIDRCAAALAPHVDWELRDALTGAAGDSWLDRVDQVQPALWAMSVALAEVWRAAGVRPDLIVGHSQGEVSAATVAGILSVQDAALIVARRSLLVRRCSGQGRMLAVDLDVDAAKAAMAGFEGSVSLAVNNGPRSCVLSGDSEAVLVLRELLEADGVFCRLVNVDYASHSPHMDALHDELVAALAAVRPRRGEMPLMSTVRLAPLDGPEMDAGYWAENLRRPVMFADAVSRMFDEGVTHVVEISPHPILASAVQELAADRDTPPRVLATLRRDQGTPAHLALALADGYASGLEPLAGVPRGQNADVPGYPWQRRPYWPAPGRVGAGRGDMAFTLVPSIGDTGLWQGGFGLGSQDTPWLADHRVDEAVVLPATAMLALVVHGAVARTGTVPAELAEIEFVNHLTLGQQPSQIMVAWRDDMAGAGAVTIASRPEGDTPERESEPTAHAIAQVRKYPDARPEAGLVAFPEHLLNAQETDPVVFYAARAAQGLHYGPTFQGLRGLRHAGDEALGELLLPQRCRAGARAECPHPALWDAALQVSLALGPAGQTVVPRAIDTVLVHHVPATPAIEGWSYAVRHDEHRFDVYLYDGRRRPLLSVLGLRLEPLPRSAAVNADEPRDYRLALVERPRGGTCGDPVAWQVEPGGADADALAAALSATVTVSTASTPAGAPPGVVFVAPRRADGLAAQRDGLMRLAALVRSCVSRARPPRLAIVTADAQATPGVRPDPGAAMYLGFGRVLVREHRELAPLLLDVAAADPDWPRACASELLARDDEDQVVLRGQDRYVGRMVVGPPPPSTAPWCRAETTYRLATSRPGRWDALEFRPLRRRAPRQGEVEIAVSQAALNFLDVMKAMGTYPDPIGAHLLGIECAGTVTGVGADVTTLDVGDRVVACGMPAMASHLTVRADHTARVPGHLADSEAVALPISLVTAWYGLVELAMLRRGETALIHSAAGGLGLAALSVARHLGARVIATAGSEDKRRYLAGLGLRDVFDSRGPNWPRDVMRATDGHGVDVVLNSLTGAAIPRGMQALADFGRFVEVGKKDIYDGRGVSLAPFSKGISVASLDLIALMRKRPERFAQMLADVWRLVAAGEIGPPPVSTVPIARAADALRTMARGEHIGKFVLDVTPDLPPSVAPEPLLDGRLRADACYLITGGLGALGLSLAEHLSEAGAGALALVGRSAPSDAARTRLTRLRRRGVRVQRYQADVADPEDLNRVLTTVRAGLPLRGVVHAAGLLDDATIATLRRDQLDRVLAPKVDGARNLDTATAADPLDFFILFSSAAALVGNPGQAAYAAANSYLDALAEERRDRGLPGLSVRWGPFTDAGLAASDERRGERLADRGMGGFSAAQAWLALDRYLGEDRHTASYLRLDPRRWFESYPDTVALPSWSVVRKAAADDASVTGGADALPDRLRAAGPAERPGLIEERVRELAGRVLRLEPAGIDRDALLTSVGIDSLLSIELRNRLEAALGLRLSPTLLWTHRTVRTLAVALAARFNAETTETTETIETTETVEPL